MWIYIKKPDCFFLILGACSTKNIPFKQFFHFLRIWRRNMCQSRPKSPPLLSKGFPNSMSDTDKSHFSHPFSANNVLYFYSVDLFYLSDFFTKERLYIFHLLFWKEVLIRSFFCWQFLPFVYIPFALLILATLFRFVIILSICSVVKRHYTFVCFDDNRYKRFVAQIDLHVPFALLTRVSSVYTIIILSISSVVRGNHFFCFCYKSYKLSVTQINLYYPFALLTRCFSFVSLLWEAYVNINMFVCFLYEAYVNIKIFFGLLWEAYVTINIFFGLLWEAYVDINIYFGLAYEFYVNTNIF